jgi:hypothetical protein
MAAFFTLANRVKYERQDQPNILTTSKVLFSRKPSPLSQKPSFSGCAFEGLVRKFYWRKQGGDHDQSQ